jgi:hypothetical protein
MRFYGWVLYRHSVCSTTARRDFILLKGNLWIKVHHLIYPLPLKNYICKEKRLQAFTLGLSGCLNHFVMDCLPVFVSHILTVKSLQFNNWNFPPVPQHRHCTLWVEIAILHSPAVHVSVAPLSADESAQKRIRRFFRTMQFRFRYPHSSVIYIRLNCCRHFCSVCIFNIFEYTNITLFLKCNIIEWHDLNLFKSWH